MLKIYVGSINDVDKEVIKDVEELFSKIRLSGTDEERKAIRYIENGEYNDEQSYIDRFGFKLYTSEMSTGCKAALCVIHCPDKIVDLVECGTNARDAIIEICRDGAILLPDVDVTFRSIESDSIDVKLDGYRITSMDRLNKYIDTEARAYPDLSTGGIEVCTQ